MESNQTRYYRCVGDIRTMIKYGKTKSGNLVRGAVTGTYSGIKNGINATQKVAVAYKSGGVSGAVKQYAKSVYETCGAKSAVETTVKASKGDAAAIATTLVNVAAVALTHQVAKGTSAASTSESTTLYRGVNNTSPVYENATQGTAIPKGGNATAVEHNGGNTNCNFTSGTTNP